MKAFLLFALLVGSFAASAQQITKGKLFKNIATLLADVNSDGKMDTIVLSSSIKEKGFYNRISVSLAGFKKSAFLAKDEWTEVDREFLDSNKNAVNSKLLFLKKTSKHAVILLFGIQVGAGYRAEFSMLNIENNIVKMVFEDTGKLDVEAPVALTDLNNDRRLDFIYRITFQCGQVLAKGKVCSYSPYFVYAVADTCKLNKPLMKAYNKKHYVFAGYKYSEKIEIYYPDDGSRPSLWRGSRTQK